MWAFGLEIKYIYLIYVYAVRLMHKHLGDRKNHGSRSKGVIWTAGEGGEGRRGVWKDEEVEEEEKEREALPYSMLHRSSVF